MSDPFYRAFEEEFRGPRETIRERLQIYLPFIQSLRDHSLTPVALDLGCGRGEWLELARSQGYQVTGVDLDDGMLAACRERDLHVVTGDALQYLQSQPDNSHSLVTGFHIAEHLPFDELRALIDESLRILSPGGLLILETPNPENLVVGTVGFYMDPTHRQPLPPQLLEFLPRHTGFARSAVVRLQASVAVAEGAPLDLMSVIGGASPDYAVVAQKSGPAHLLDAVSPAFERKYGPDLNMLAARYQQQLDQRLYTIEQHVAETRARVDQARAQADHYAAELKMVYSSRSWQITAPLRAGQTALRRARQLGPVGTCKVVMRRSARWAKFIFNRLRGRSVSSSEDIPVELRDLGPEGRQWHRQLERAVQSSTQNGDDARERRTPDDTKPDQQ